MENIIVFDNSLKDEILSIFNKKIEEGTGLIVEKLDPTQKVLSPKGEEITVEKFAGIQKGSEVFITSDIVSLIKLSKDGR